MEQENRSVPGSMADHPKRSFSSDTTEPPPNPTPRARVGSATRASAKTTTRATPRGCRAGSRGRAHRRRGRVEAVPRRESARRIGKSPRESQWIARNTRIRRTRIARAARSNPHPVGNIPPRDTAIASLTSMHDSAENRRGAQLRTTPRNRQPNPRATNGRPGWHPSTSTDSTSSSSPS